MTGPLMATPAHAQEERHGLSLFGSLKYDADFEHFEYVNPDAPKGGTLRYSSIGSFDSLHPFIIKGSPATGLTFIYDTLMASAYDEPASEYGLLAESVSYPDDYSSVTFTLRTQAKWHDGTRITPEDVIWSFETLKANMPFYNAYYADVESAEKLSPLKVRFNFAISGNRELPQIVGQLIVLPKHYWATRDFTATTLEPPLGSGPYRVSVVDAPKSITYERVNDYWGKDLPVNVGAHNFDRIRFDYYGDTTVALEAFKGDQLDVRFENSAKDWATAYDFPARREGRVRLEELRTLNPETMQGFVMNMRRDKFKDARVREAFNLAFDFEWANKTLFYGQYVRTDSYFANSELASSGIPEGTELAFLEPFRAQLPAPLFTEPFANPVTDGSGDNRRQLRTATRLLQEAGYTVNGDGVLVHTETGEAFETEFLLVSPVFERIVQPYLQTLAKLGIKGSIRIVDTSQYQARLDTYDFDIVIGNFGQSLSPGNEQREFWGCAAAEQKGGRNIAGICNPVVEALVDEVIFAKDRETLVAATRSLDRVLLWNHYVVPQWHIPYLRAAIWDRIQHPDPTPAFNPGFPTTWWHVETTN
ncbi:MAG: ABC transporter substrate-binding protein [Alphaproteobacteria bacterium]|nr:ABC transporter substrate-binding protein [Alphaproteobacteria bacterium]MBO6627588.1 ABC transporter substrate-binding protein [Alphaproteobacteria bacterium]